MKDQRLRYTLLFAALGALFFIPFLGGVHLFDWDEVNFAEISREMLIMEDYTRIYVNFLPFWEKPPFFFWMQALAMQLFGVGEFAARFPNAICGVITLALLYNLGRHLYDHRFGILWAGVYLGSVLPFLYFKSGIIDPFFNLFIFTGLYLFVLFYWKKEGFEGIRMKRNKWTYLFWAGFLIGMGILTKGQVAYLIAVLTMGVYWIFQRFRMYVSIPQFLFFSIAATLVTLSWYGLETWKNGTWFIEEFNKYQFRLFSTPDAGHKGFPGYHFVVLLVGCFPVSVFALRSFFGKLAGDERAFEVDFRRWMKILFWVVLILFTVVRSKIVHYSSMCYFPLTFLGAFVIYQIVRGELRLSGWMKGLLWGIGGLYALAIIALPVIGQDPQVLEPLFRKDPFAQGNLEAGVHWTGWEVLPALLLLAVLWIGLRQFSRQRPFRGFAILFGGSAIFVFTTLIFFIKRIEGYSQRAAVEFFEERAGEDSYAVTYGYKSYVHLFYTCKPRPLNEASLDKAWLLQGDIDKPVYVSAKIHKAEELVSRYPGFEEIGRKNGFVFFRRMPAN